MSSTQAVVAYQTSTATQGATSTLTTTTAAFITSSLGLLVPVNGSTTTVIDRQMSALAAGSGASVAMFNIRRYDLGMVASLDPVGFAVLGPVSSASGLLETLAGVSTASFGLASTITSGRISTDPIGTATIGGTMGARLIVNDTISSTYQFRDPTTGDLANPTSMTVTITPPYGTATTYTYPNAAITSSATGVFTVSFTATLRGRWSVAWDASVSAGRDVTRRSTLVSAA